MRKLYLDDIPLGKAKQIIQKSLDEVGLWKILKSEKVVISEKLVGRVTAEPVWALISSPHYHAAGMDGYAVSAEQIQGASSTNPIIIEIGKFAFYVDTGDLLPEKTNVVIPIEEVELLDDDGQLAKNTIDAKRIRIRTSLPPWKNIRALGEDIVASELVLPQGRVLRPVDLGAAAASGNVTIQVSCRPKVYIIPTGSEIIPLGETIEPGKIIEFNSIMLASQLNSWGAEAIRCSIVKDDPESIRNSIIEVLHDADLILIVAGSSAGSEDYTASVINSLGKVLFHGVAVRPGHPVIFGMLDYDKRVVPVLGVPGYPVSCVLTAEIFVEPIIAKWLGREPIVKDTVEALITKKVLSPAGDDDYLRVIVGEIDSQMIAAPIARGAGVISSLVKADGLVIIPNGSQGLNAHEKVLVHLYTTRNELKKTILSIGSHDLLLDILAQQMSKYNRRLVSSNVGSLGGLLALERGFAHFAGSHLLDPETGVYNLRYVKEYIQKYKIVLLHFAEREQGLIVAKGNPKKIFSLNDLTRYDVRFINRQQGSGTRVLLDYHLSQLGISPSGISGYEQEEYTHLSLAAAIMAGRADCGLGIPSAADALNLDFVPLYKEQYDLVIPYPYIENKFLEPIIDILQSFEWKELAQRFRGYDLEHCGEITFVE